MNRAIKFKLKNGKVVTIRRLKPEDYDADMKFLEEFAKGPSAKWTGNNLEHNCHQGKRLQKIGQMKTAYLSLLLTVIK